MYFDPAQEPIPGQEPIPRAEIIVEGPVFINPGLATILRCSTTNGTTTPTWKLNNIIIRQSRRFQLRPLENELQVEDFDEDIAGNYTCVVRNILGDVKVTSAAVTLQLRSK